MSEIVLTHGQMILFCLLVLLGFSLSQIDMLWDRVGWAFEWVYLELFGGDSHG